MHINLPDRIPTAALPDEIKAAIVRLEKEGLLFVADVRITLRAFNEDDRECYPADESGRHDMGFTMTSPEAGVDKPSGAREIRWELPGMNPEPVKHDGLRALWDLFPGARTDDA